MQQIERITTVTSDATLKGTGMPTDRDNLDTMIRFEVTDLGNRNLPQTTATLQTTNQKGRRSSDPTTDIFDDENPTSNIVEPTSPNSSILIDNPVPGPSFAFGMNQFDSTHTTDHEEEDQPFTSSVILSPETAGHCNVLKRRHIPGNVDQEHEESPINTQIAEENDDWKKKPHFERRRIFNLAKHIISIVLIILDLVFDWVEYFEMNKTGNYTIAAERSVKNVEFTIECEGTGKTIQFIFLVFTIVATILSVIQILHIIYQMFHEIKGEMKDTKINLEYVETFVFLFFIEISQLLLIMGFYNVCTLDCTVDATEILIALNGLFSFFKLSWRFFTSCKCCTVYWKNPIIQRPVQRRPIRTGSPKNIGSREGDCCRSCECSEHTNTCIMSFWVPFLVLVILFLPCILVYCIVKKCDCDVCDSKVGDPERAQHKWKCEQSCKCCILRCFPSRFPEQDTEACDCTCKQCLSCEKFCQCCFIRCFPTKLPIPKDDFIECKCGECLRCERNCLCCFLRCCPTYLVPPKYEICTCRCGDCIAFERPCKCFTFRCCPTHLDPPQYDIWNCSCRECLACTMPCCPCFIYRCFPKFLIPPHPDVCTCKCGDCMSCERNCRCCLLRCFPTHLVPPKSDIFTCRCGDCIAFERPCKCFTFRCCPTHLDPPQDDIWNCSCRECLACTMPCCPCFIFRCFPAFLIPSHPDVCTCRCSECLSCNLPCKCFSFRCFPEYQKPPKSDWFECTCGDCINCERNCCCCILRCFPSYVEEDDFCTCILRKCLACQKSFACCLCRCFPSKLDPPINGIFKCTCGKCMSCEKKCCCCIMRCCPSDLRPPKHDCFECTCCNNQVYPIPIIVQPQHNSECGTRRRSTTPSSPPLISVITTQPIPQPRLLVMQQLTPMIIPQEPIPPQRKHGKQLCRKCSLKCINFLVAVFILLVIMLLLFYLFLLVVEILFVFVCVEDEWLILSTQELLVQNYLKLFNI